MNQDHLKPTLEHHQKRFDALPELAAADRGFYSEDNLTACKQAGDECTRRNNCRCHDDPANRHGPYHYWTRKVQGETMSVSLTDEQLARVQAWIENGRTLGRVVKQMQHESLRAFALLTGKRVQKTTAGRRR